MREGGTRAQSSAETLDSSFSLNLLLSFSSPPYTQPTTTARRRQVGRADLDGARRLRARRRGRLHARLYGVVHAPRAADAVHVPGGGAASQGNGHGQPVMMRASAPRCGGGCRFQLPLAAAGRPAAAGGGGAAAPRARRQPAAVSAAAACTSPHIGGGPPFAPQNQLLFLCVASPPASPSHALSPNFLLASLSQLPKTLIRLRLLPARPRPGAARSSARRRARNCA